MAAVYVHVRRRENNIRRNRVFRDRDNPLDYLDDDDIVRKYRLSRPMILELCGMFQNQLARPTKRSHAFPVSLQLMVALRFYATGSFQLANADVHRNVTQCLKNVCNQYISMPTDPASQQALKQGFYDISNFPNVIGAVDGTHVRIKSPAVDEHLYVNRKNYHSLNVMGVCDSNLKFLNIVAKWPGSTHDSFALRNSRLCEMFEDGDIRDGWLLGDSGYPLRPWLLTPVINPTTRHDQRYNASHMRTRCAVERSFGVLKSRFRCIDTTAGTLLYSPVRCCDIIVAVVVLHNMCINNRIPLPPGNDNPRDQGNIDGQQYVGNQNDGAVIRTRLINNRFNN
ncbi:putative nuclease HARBI1 [Mytilus edulis]|uniref:putative nuclease HARBI1 n=1 Tax=Mytilus edulis TaxID=6550 RepID=UPI0039EEA5F4